VIDVFVGGLDLPELHFGRVDPEATGWPHTGQQKRNCPSRFCIERGRAPGAPATFLCGMD
jgi:hypothetical protein